MTDLPWPKRGDNPFSVIDPDPDSPTWACLNWLAGIGFDDSGLSQAFKTVADKAISELLTGNDHRHPDALFLPIAYLYRHSLELKLKRLLRLGLQLELEETTEHIEECLACHNLHRLWVVVRRILKAFWPDGSDADLNATEGIIVAFHKVDRSGQTLRYTRDIEGNPTLSDLPGSADLLHVQRTFEGLFSMLDGCECSFLEALDDMNEMRANYW